MSPAGAIRVGGIGAFALAVLFGAGRLAGVRLGFGGDGSGALNGIPVKRGPLRISVVERANLKAKSSVVLRSEIEGRTTILHLIEEGSHVRPGDLLCELDASNLVERRVTQEIGLQNAEAALVKAKQQLEIQRSQNESDIAKARQELDFAQRDLEKYLEGEWPQELQKAREDILLAEEDGARKEDELAWSLKLNEKGFLTTTELEADRLAFNSAKIFLAQRERALTLLQEYDHPRRTLELESAITERKRELRRVEMQAEARIIDYEANLRSTEVRHRLEREKQEKLDDQIAKGRIFAPVAGMVVYAKEGQGRHSSAEPIQEGTEVRERQEIITIPSSEGMIAETSLHESVLEKVQEGMSCLLTVDALPDRVFRGRVKFKATLPDQNSWWANPDLRVYRTEVEILDTDESLATGMSCGVEIVVRDIEDCLHIPVQSVFLNRGRTVCFVSENGRVELREIDTGLDNAKFVIVEAGLEEGEIVLLSQPAGFTLEPAVEEPEAAPPVEPPPPPTAAGVPEGHGSPGRAGRPAMTAGSDSG